MEATPDKLTRPQGFDLRLARPFRARVAQTFILASPVDFEAAMLAPVRDSHLSERTCYGLLSCVETEGVRSATTAGISNGSPPRQGMKDTRSCFRSR